VIIFGRADLSLERIMNVIFGIFTGLRFHHGRSIFPVNFIIVTFVLHECSVKTGIIRSCLVQRLFDAMHA
jgi:hypothetical protein